MGKKSRRAQRAPDARAQRAPDARAQMPPDGTILLLNQEGLSALRKAASISESHLPDISAISDIPTFDRDSHDYLYRQKYEFFYDVKSRPKIVHFTRQAVSRQIETEAGNEWKPRSKKLFSVSVSTLLWNGQLVGERKAAALERLHVALADDSILKGSVPKKTDFEFEEDGVTCKPLPLQYVLSTSASTGVEMGQLVDIAMKDIQEEEESADYSRCSIASKDHQIKAAIRLRSRLGLAPLPQEAFEKVAETELCAALQAEIVAIPDLEPLGPKERALFIPPRPSCEFEEDTAQLPEGAKLFKTGFNRDDPIERMLDDSMFRAVDFAVEQKLSAPTDLFVVTPDEGSERGVRCIFATAAGQEAIRQAVQRMSVESDSGDEGAP